GAIRRVCHRPGGSALVAGAGERRGRPGQAGAVLRPHGGPFHAADAGRARLRRPSLVNVRNQTIRKEKNMPGLTEYGKIFRDWEGLLGAAEKRAALLPGADDLKATLAGHLTKARDLKLKQEGFDGDKQETTELLRSVVKEGRDAASMLRAF